MKKLLIRADDLGFSEGVNYGIAKTVEIGVVKSVGIMTNMEAAEHGVNLLKGKNVCFGQHTNICVGRPIIDPYKIPSLCGENGEFKSSREYRDAKKAGINFVALDEVVIEIEAQYQRFKELTGQEPKYFEGHAVSSDNFFKGLEIVAKNHGLPYLEMKMDGNPITFKNTKVYAYIPKDFQSYEQNPFYAIQDAVEHGHEDGVDMMVFHPGYIDGYLLEKSSMTTTRVKEAAMLSAISTKEWLEKQDIHQVTYEELE